MAINKRKTLDAAQKFARKGQYEKAYKSFNDYLTVESRDAKVRLDLGQAYLKGGQPEKAIDTFLKVAAQWSKDGFDAKAIAVYKQIIALDSKRAEIYEPLSELYQCLGLNSEAMRALQTGAECYQAEGQQKQALGLLRRVGSIDPSNTTTRLKVAELLRKESLNGEAIAEYEEIAAEFIRQGEVRGAIDTYQRILEIEPDRSSTLMTIAGILIDEGDFDGAQFHIMKMREVDPNYLEAAELLCKVMEIKGNKEGTAEAYRAVAEIHRNRGDEDKAREILQRFIPAEPLTVDLSETSEEEGAVARNRDLETDEDIAIGGPMDGDLALERDKMELEIGDNTYDAQADELSLDEVSLDEIVIENEPILEEATPSAADAPDMGDVTLDVEQVLAEVSVYRRYKKFDKAIESLEGLLSVHPNALGAHDKLGELHRERGDEDAAQAQWNQALAIAQGQADVEQIGHFEALLGLESGDGESAEIELTLEAPADSVQGLDDELDLDELDLEEDVQGLEPNGADAVAADEPTATEIDIDLTDGLDDEDEPAEESASEVSDTGVTLEEEIEFDEEIEFEDEIEEPVAEEADTAEGEVALDEEISFDDEIELEFEETTPDLSESTGAPAAVELDVEPEPEPAEVTEEPGVDATSAGAPNIQADLELAEFYFEQGIVDDAEALYRQILEAAPGHPQAQLRLGEIEASSGGEAAAAEEEIEFEAVQDSAEEESPAEEGAEVSVEDDMDDALDIFDEEDELGLEVPADLVEEAASGPREDAAPALEDPLATTQAAAAGAAAEAERLAGELVELEKKRAEAVEAAHLAAERAAIEAKRVADEAAAEAKRVSEEAEAEAEHRREAAEAAAAEAQRMAESVSDLSQSGFNPHVEDPAAVQEEEGAGDDLFDLRAELSGVIESVEQGAAPSHIGDDDQESFHAIFSEFKKGVDEIVEEGDFQTHFDLGIAYREMGLYGDAIGEFQSALGASADSLDCLHMMGLCAMDLDRGTDAVAHFKQALSSPDVDAVQQQAVRYDLARALETEGHLAEALEAFQQVFAADPEFCEVKGLIEAIEVRIVAGDEPEPVAAGDEETGESFDDLISDPELGFDIPQEIDSQAAIVEETVEIEAELSLDLGGELRSELEDEDPELVAEEITLEAVILEDVEEVAEEAPAPRSKRRKKKKTFV